MYIQNLNTNKWEKRIDKLEKSTYDLLRQEVEKMRFYSKCIDGTSYTAIDSLNNIYKKLNYLDNSTWHYDLSSSPYSTVSTGDNIINSSTLNKYNDYLLEGGMSIENTFSDKKVITNNLDNFLEVDLMTIDEIEDLLSEKLGLYIDSIRVKEGHRVLVKNQKTFVTINSTIDPNTFFSGNYYIVSNDVSTTSYFYYNETNGIYIFTNNRLIKNKELDIYKSNMKY